MITEILKKDERDKSGLRYVMLQNNSAKLKKQIGKQRSILQKMIEG